MSNQAISGLLNLYKPAGWTSRDVVNRVERLTKPARAGHAGTLDPLAVGVLIVAVGSSTRLINAVQERSKEYRGTFQLGCRSDTDDNTGEITPVEFNHQPTRDEIEFLLPRFIGEITQVPPRFSAVHVNGRRAYDLARKGQSVDLAPRQVHVSRLEILDYVWPRLELMIECGSGTYIRSIGRDLGDLLGCGAMMTDLVRTRIGPFRSEDSIRVDDLQKENITTHLQSPVLAVEHWPQHICTPSELWDIAHGRSIVPQPPIEPGHVALLTPNGKLAALAETKTLGRVVPTQVFIDRAELK